MASLLRSGDLVAESFTVEDILKLARAGKLRLPSFQRGLKWKKPDVRQLFDSILRQFPIGSLLLWKQQLEASRGSLGAFGFESPGGEGYLIVDGQQRIVSLVSALLHPDERPAGDLGAVWYDLQDETFNHRASGQQPPRTWIPLNLLPERHRLHEWGMRFDDRSLVDRAFRLEEALLRYTVPAYIVPEGAEREGLQLIFSRINFAGAQMKEDDVFQALFGDEGEPKPLEALASWLDEQTGFGRLQTSWLLRCVKAVGGLDPRKAYSENDALPSALMADTRAALRRAVELLQEVGFHHMKLLPYRLPLIVLAAFFRMHPSPSPLTRKLLRRWIWRGAVGGEHGQSNHATVAAYMGDLGPDEEACALRFLGRVRRDCPCPDPEAPWNGRNAVSRIFESLLLSLSPLDPVTESPIELGLVQDELSARDPGEVFRQIPDAVPGPVASRLLLPRPHRLADLVDASSETLHSHAIDDEARTALLAGDHAGFMHRRADRLREEMSRLIARHAEPHAIDRPSIQKLATGELAC